MRRGVNFSIENRRARGVESQVPRNGEAKADCSRIAVNPWRKG